MAWAPYTVSVPMAPSSEEPSVVPSPTAPSCGLPDPFRAGYVTAHMLTQALRAWQQGRHVWGCTCDPCKTWSTIGVRLRGSIWQSRWSGRACGLGGE